MASQENKVIFEISTGSILKIIGITVLVVLVYLLRDLVFLVFVSLVLSAVFDPWVTWLQNKARLPRGLGMLIIYLLLLGVFALALILLIPPLIEQVGQMISVVPSYFEDFSGGFTAVQNFAHTRGLDTNLQQVLISFQNVLQRAAGGILPAISSIFGSIFNVVTTLVLTFYMVTQKKWMKELSRMLVPARYNRYFFDVIDRVKVKLGAWFTGQIVLCFIIGLASYIALVLIGVKYALTLALVAGLFEFIPYVGPILSAIPAAFFGFTQDAWFFRGFIVIFAFWLIQWLENNLIVPKVMSKSVGLNPLVILLSMLIGANLLGFAGVILAVPVSASLSILVSDVLFKDGGEQ